MENVENREPKKFKEALLHFRQHRVDPKTGKTVLKNNGGYTVLIHRCKEEQYKDEYKIAVARCGKNDNFNRKVGAAIVRGRMECTRRLTTGIFDKEQAVAELAYMAERTHEHYKKEFFERLLEKLV